MADFVSPEAFAAQSPTPQPSTAVATGQPVQLDSSGAQARMSAAKMFEDIGGAAKEYANQLDVVSAQDALNKLRAKQADLTFGQDGFMNVKGAAVTDPNRPGGPLADDYKARFQAATDDISGSLSPGARRMFMPHVGFAQSRFLMELGRHSVAETEKRQEGVYKDGQSQLQADTVRNASDPQKVMDNAQRARTQAETLAYFKGLPTAAAGQAAVSSMLRIATETMLGSGANRQALSYFESIKGQLDGPDLVALQGKIKSVQNGVRGEDLANEEAARLGLPAIPSEDTSAGGSGREQTGQDESGGNYNAVNRTSGAFGKYQFMPDTWSSVARAHPELGLPFNMRQATPQQQDAAKVAFDRDNGQVLRSNGFEPTAANLYLAHRFGAQGAMTFLSARPDAKMSDVMPASWVAQNPDMQNVTVGRFAQSVQSRYGDKTAFGTPSISIDGAPVFKGDLKAGYEQAALSAMQRTDYNAFEKAKAIALLTKQRMQLTAFQEASTKSLDDQAHATTASIIANPSLFKPGTFDDFANRYAALGQQETATRYKMLASMEGSFKDGLQSATDAQLEMLKQLAPEGLPKQIVEGYISGNAKMRTDALAQGNALSAQLKKSVETDGVRPSGLMSIAQQAIDHYTHAGKPEKVQEVADFMNAALEAEHVNTGGSQEAANAIAQMKEAASRGQSNAQRLQVLSVAQNLFASQQKLIDQDPYKAGTSIYPQVGPAPQFDWTNPESIWQTLDIRSNQARNIQSLTGRDTIPFTNEEMEGVRLGLDKGDPQTNAQTLQSLGKFLPGDMIPGVSKALVGKGAGDGVSQSYGAALGLFSSGNAADAAVAGDILKGAAIRKARGEDAKAATPAQDTWKQELQTKLGTSLGRVDPRQKTMIEQAIQSVYTYRMARSGQSAEKFDATVMDDSIKSVLGEAVNVNGGKVYPPERGQTSYDVLRALNSIDDNDVKGLKTIDGTDIPARLIRGAQLENVGTGQYVVTVRDPRTGMRAEIPDPKNPRNAWVLDLSEYNERGKAQKAAGVLPPAPTLLDEALRTRRMAPASPTESVSP